MKHGSLILIGNLIPLAGYLLLGWDTQHILLFYIAELVIVELINAAKIGILTYSREIRVTTTAGSLAGAALIVLFHLAVFLLGLVGRLFCSRCRRPAYRGQLLAFRGIGSVLH